MSKKNDGNLKEDSIDIIELISIILKNKNTIIKITLFFTLIGIVYSLSLNNVYIASSTFYPHIEKNNSSQGLKSLAGLAGIEISSEISNNIPPTLYPNIISSPQFKIEILNQKLILNENELSFREYLKNTIFQESLSLKQIL